MRSLKIAVVALVAIFGVPGAAWAQTAGAYLQPGSIDEPWMAPGSTFTVDIMGDFACPAGTGINGVSLALDYDPGILGFVQSQVGPFWGTGPFNAYFLVANDAGTQSGNGRPGHYYLAGVILGAPVNTGTRKLMIARLTFQLLAAGSTSLTLLSG